MMLFISYFKSRYLYPDTELQTCKTTSVMTNICNTLTIPQEPRNKIFFSHLSHSIHCCAFRSRSSLPCTAHRSNHPLADSRFQTTTTSTTTTTTPSTTARVPSAHETATVPIIPAASDPDRPRVIVTNGMPFVPKLDSPDPAPALTTEVRRERGRLAWPGAGPHHRCS